MLYELVAIVPSALYILPIEVLVTLLDFLFTLVVVDTPKGVTGRQKRFKELLTERPLVIDKPVRNSRYHPTITQLTSTYLGTQSQPS